MVEKIYCLTSEYKTMSASMGGSDDDYSIWWGYHDDTEDLFHDWGESPVTRSFQGVRVPDLARDETSHEKERKKNGEQKAREAKRQVHSMIGVAMLTVMATLTVQAAVRKARAVYKQTKARSRARRHRDKRRPQIRGRT